MTHKHSKHQWVLTPERYLSIPELEQLLKSCSTRKEAALLSGRKTPIKDWFLIRLAMETGLRVQEIADLKCEDIHISRDTNSALFVRSGKGGKSRVVYFGSGLAHDLTWFLDWKGSINEPVSASSPLLSTKGRAMSKRALQKSYERSRQVARIKQAAGVGIHSLRHTYASCLLLSSGNNFDLVKDQLGHASVQTTEIYAHVFSNVMKDALEGLYDFIAAKPDRTLKKDKYENSIH